MSASGRYRSRAYHVSILTRREAGCNREKWLQVLEDQRKRVSILTRREAGCNPTTMANGDVDVALLGSFNPHPT